MTVGGDQPRTFIHWLIWMLMQAGVLMLFAWRVPLSARFPEPIENAGLIALVVTQLIFSATLAPALLPGWSALACAIAGMIPLTLPATLLGGRPAADALAPMVLVSLWLGVFTICGSWRDPALRAVTGVLFLLLNVCAPILLYLNWEFGLRPVKLDGIAALISPTLGAITTCLHGWDRWWIFLLPALFIAIVGLTRLISDAKSEADGRIAKTMG